MRIAIIFIYLLSQAVAFAEAELVSFSEIKVVQDPYKASLVNFEKAGTMVRFNMDKIKSADRSQIFMKGEAEKLFSEKDLEMIKQENDFSTWMSLKNNILSLTQPFCGVTLFYPGDTELSEDLIDNDTLWSVTSAKIKNKADEVGQSREFEILLEAKGRGNYSISIAKLVCHSPYAYEHTVGGEYTELEIVKKSFAENIQFFVESDQVDTLLVEE